MRVEGRNNYRLMALLCGCAVWTSIAGRPAVAEEKVVIPFDFVSKFDNGRYGEMVGDMIFKKLQAERGFVVPESMLDVRDFCKTNKLSPSPEMPLEQVRKIVVEDFGGHVGIWGSIERAPGAEWEVYDLVIQCVDFSEAEPKVLYECSARTNSVSEVPHLYVKQMIDALYGRKPGEPPPPDPLVEKNWLENPNLVQGDFQKGAAGVPDGWESTGAQPREPLGKMVRWIVDVGNPSNRVIRFTFGADIGDSSGVMYYSKFFPVEEGATYRFQCRWRSNGPEAKVFIKCADEVGTQYRTESQVGKGDASATRKAYIPEEAQTREVYRSQQNLKGPKNTWNTQTQDFTPKHTKYTPRWGRVMLYAYLGAGVVEFDDVVVKQIMPASPGEQIKERRHSLDTKVTIEEMEVNERRSQTPPAEPKK